MGSQAPPTTPMQGEEPTSPLSERSRLPTALTPPSSSRSTRAPGERSWKDGRRARRWAEPPFLGEAPPPVRPRPSPPHLTATQVQVEVAQVGVGGQALEERPGEGGVMGENGRGLPTKPRLFLLIRCGAPPQGGGTHLRASGGTRTPARLTWARAKALQKNCRRVGGVSRAFLGGWGYISHTHPAANRTVRNPTGRGGGPRMPNRVLDHPTGSLTNQWGP